MKKRNEGYSLIEILVAIVLLGLIVVPTCTSLVMSTKMNARAEEMMRSQLAVSSAVETLMAEGIDATMLSNDPTEDGTYLKRFPDVKITANELKNSEDVILYYNVEVKSKDDLVTVTTQIRKAGGIQ